jgi:hypothetical protein
MWQAILIAIATAAGKVALSFLDKYIDKEQAVKDAQAVTEQDTKEIADEQAKVNAAAGGTSHDVADRLRARLSKAGKSG